MVKEQLQSIVLIAKGMVKSIALPVVAMAFGTVVFVAVVVL